MNNNKAPEDIQKRLATVLLKGLLVPVLTLGIYAVAPQWLSNNVRQQVVAAINAGTNLTPSERESRLKKESHIDYRQVCLDPSPDMRRLHDGLWKAGIVSTYKRLQWGLYLSGVLVAVAVLSIVAVFILNKSARGSPRALLRSYRLGWGISIAAALINVFLLIPLLTYGIFFELTVLLAHHYYPQMLLAIVVGGIFALWQSASILLKRVPMEFKEPMSREVTPQEAPALWRLAREAAARLQTQPPDSIVIGLQVNFFVTELAVVHDNGKSQGRTLYLSLPLLKEFSEEEVLSIIGTTRAFHGRGHADDPAPFCRRTRSLWRRRSAALSQRFSQPTISR